MAWTEGRRPHMGSGSWAWRRAVTSRNRTIGWRRQRRLGNHTIAALWCVFCDVHHCQSRSLNRPFARHLALRWPQREQASDRDEAGKV
jgi:hypothetical protein